MTCDISLIIPSTGQISHLGRLLQSIAQQDYPTENFEALFLVNGDLTEVDKVKIEQLLGSVPVRSRIFFDTQRGVNRARNNGIRMSQGSLLLFLDDDCVLTKKNFLREHIEYHAKNKQIFAFGGGYALPTESTFFDAVYNYIQMEWYFSGITDGVERRTQYLLGGNFSVKKKLLLEHQLLFDEMLVYGGTEYEFFLRANQSQLISQAIELELLHNAQVGFLSLTRKLYKQGQGKAYVDQKFSFERMENSEVLVSSRKRLGLKFRLALLFCNYFFWCGYDKKRSGILYFVKRILSDLLGFLNQLRFSVFETTREQLEEKRKKGDRF
jgi:glycosyltransferase involved in cell wall biosynthesis